MYDDYEERKMAFGATILFSEMNPPAARESAFNDWYDLEHIPIRMNAPGFISAQRYLAAPSNYLAVYEMESQAALKTSAYETIKSRPSALTREMLSSVSGFTRYIGNQISWTCKPDQAGQMQDALLYAVWFDVPPARLSAFDDWYEQDHVPILMEADEWIAVRRFDIVESDPVPFNRLALHYIKDLSALDSPARQRARATPWRAKLAEEDWFKGVYKIFARHGARQLAQVSKRA
jgi:hypothetical protein